MYNVAVVLASCCVFNNDLHVLKTDLFLIKNSLTAGKSGFPEWQNKQEDRCCGLWPTVKYIDTKCFPFQFACSINNVWLLF